MKEIAIITSRFAGAAADAAALFAEGNKLRVRTVVTDVEIDADIMRRLSSLGVRTVTADYREIPGILSSLRSEGVEMFAFTGFDHPVPEGFEAMSVVCGNPEELSRMIVRTLLRPAEATHGVHDEGPVRDNAVSPDSMEHQDSAKCQDSPYKEKSVEQEWAERLRLDYDEERARKGAVPPPPPSPAPAAPGVAMQPHPVPPPATPRQAGYEERPPMPDTYLAWAVLATLLCCIVPGIIGIVFASQVSQKYYIGDYAGAEKASRYAQICIIISIVLGMISATLYFPMMLFS